MKKCPFCGADLAEEAQFCLYCMTPLNEKEQILPAKRRPKGWLFALGGVLHLTAVLLLLLWPRSTGEPNGSTMRKPTPSSAATSAGITTVPSTTAPTTVPTTVSTTLSSTSNEVRYHYRAAKTSDDIGPSYSNPGNHIVITGVENPASDGVYNIPDTIDGQTVVAIASSAFSDSDATVVYIPASVKTVHNYAFLGCPLSDVYFNGKAIHCYDSAFPSGFVLHCAPECRSRSWNYYVDFISDLGATWKEWHNMPLMSATDEYGVVYNYRMSTASDHPGDPNYQNPGNHITITSIHTPPADQNYHIPETLDGMTVAFIGPMAFHKTVAHSLYIPESVLAVSGSIFYRGVINDIYFCHDLYMPSSCLPMLSEVTLHCPKNARSGADGKVYSEDPRFFSALDWEEWNGEA